MNYDPPLTKGEKRRLEYGLPLRRCSNCGKPLAWGMVPSGSGMLETWTCPIKACRERYAATSQGICLFLDPPDEEGE